MTRRYAGLKAWQWFVVVLLASVNALGMVGPAATLGAFVGGGIVLYAVALALSKALRGRDAGANEA